MQSYNELILVFEDYHQKQTLDEKYDVYRAMRYIMTMKSKRIRPVLVLMACNLFKGNIKYALPVALGIEVYHNSTLIHDDIMDKASTRRGISTVHKVFGNNVAINSGDMMFTLAYDYLLNTKKEYTHELFSVFSKNAIRVVEGQSKDMEFERRTNVTESEYIEMIEGKTSVLLACALQMGAIVANADKTDQKKIYNFGLNLGLSFQIQDDYLDAFGEPNEVGKRVGGDIIMNKKTLLLLKALEFSSAAQRKKINALLEEKNKQKKVKEMLVLMEQTGAKAYSEKLMDAYYKKAIKSLKVITTAEEYKTPLLELAHLLRYRKK